MATAVKQSADIRKFTGFIAPDGTTHDTLKKASDYTKELKVKAALAAFANVMPYSNIGVITDGEDGNGSAVVYASNLPEFLLAHRAEILAAFNQEVTLRVPRKIKEVKSKVAPEMVPALPALDVIEDINVLDDTDNLDDLVESLTT